jgi:rhamnosyltransferase
MKKSIYIIGSKGIPAKYGGFETFVEKLTEYQQDDEVQYYVACMQENSEKSDIYETFFEHNKAKCFNIKVPNIGSAKAIIYDIMALKKAIEISKKNKDINPIFYILACRIGPFIGYFKKKIRDMNGQLFVNPDGHEWLRMKWNFFVRKYWKFSEEKMIRSSDAIICDSKNIETYIKNEYKKFNPQTTFIAYGTDTDNSSYTSSSYEVQNWYENKSLKENNYFLVVGRFVPENNYEIMIKEFMKTETDKDFVLITNVERNAFFDKLEKKTGFSMDNRIKFVGTVYDQNLLKYIRENAFAYIHGHEVGGTNPSLLEAMSFTKKNLLFDVGFNKEVGRNQALYWSKEVNNLKNLIDRLDIEDFSKLNPRDIVIAHYNWERIIEKYEKFFQAYK